MNQDTRDRPEYGKTQSVPAALDLLGTVTCLTFLLEGSVGFDLLGEEVMGDGETERASDCGCLATFSWKLRDPPTEDGAGDIGPGQVVVCGVVRPEDSYHRVSCEGATTRHHPPFTT